MDEPAYVLEQSAAERERLQYQATLLAPDTRALFAECGLAPGMRVLDIGCGPGDVSLLAAALVGPHGSVTGIDRDPAQIALARQRAGGGGRDNVAFIEADLHTFDDPQSFDAVVGRFVITHARDWPATIARLARLVRPGGALAFHEVGVGAGWALTDSPPGLLPPLMHAAAAIISRLVAIANGGARAPVELAAALAPHGAAVSRLSQHAVIGRAALTAYLTYFLDTLVSALPAARALGVEGAETFDLAAARADLAAAMARPEAEHGVVDGSPTVLAWVRLA